MRDIVVAFGPPLPMRSQAPDVKQAVFELSVSSWQQHVETFPTIPQAWLLPTKRRLGSTVVLDSAGTALSNRRLITAVLLFAAALRRLCPEPRIGILLPASSAGAIGNLAGWVAGKVVVNLNCTVSRKAIAAALASAEIRHIVTAERFTRRLAGRGLAVEQLFQGAELHPMEEIRAQFGRARTILASAAASLLPAGRLLRLFGRVSNPQATAAILFSSGSEGRPEGVELTHRNILANVRQIADILNPEADDLLLANLPLFHAFGLTATTATPSP
jgi:acyl-[acyl-carrier-protein]-phospholipid O-acyltransferase/long-chain-fatty-acid--[acyl-carrier-protein] ligase